MRGCRPRVEGAHKATVIAQLEVSEGKVVQLFTLPDTNGTLTANGTPTAIGGAVNEDAPAPIHTS